MDKLLYIIRHGQTNLNLGGIVQGRGIDEPLNETGHQQAQAFYRAYKDVPFDKIYTSRLIRTHQTVEPFVRDGIPHEALEGLDEISWGKYEGQKQGPEIRAGLEALVDSWRNGALDQAVEQGESPLQLIERQRTAMELILSREEEKRVLICMHGRAMRILLTWLTGLHPRMMDTFPHNNTALYQVQIRDGFGEIVDAFNTKHLKD